MSFAAVPSASLLNGCLFMCVLSEICDFVVADLKEQHTSIQFCSKLGKTASETYETLKIVFAENVMEIKQTSDWFSVFKRGENSVEDC